MEQVLSSFHSHGALIKESHGFFHGLIWKIRSEQDTITAESAHCRVIGKRWEVSAGGNQDIIFEVIARIVFTLDTLRLVLSNEDSFIRYAGRPFSRGNAFLFINYLTSTVSLISRKVKTILANFEVNTVVFGDMACVKLWCHLLQGSLCCHNLSTPV